MEVIGVLLSIFIVAFTSVLLFFTQQRNINIEKRKKKTSDKRKHSSESERHCLTKEHENSKSHVNTSSKTIRPAIFVTESNDDENVLLADSDNEKKSESKTEKESVQRTDSESRLEKDNKSGDDHDNVGNTITDAKPEQNGEVTCNNEHHDNVDNTITDVKPEQNGELCFNNEHHISSIKDIHHDTKYKDQPTGMLTTHDANTNEGEKELEMTKGQNTEDKREVMGKIFDDFVDNLLEKILSKGTDSSLLDLKTTNADNSRKFERTECLKTNEKDKKDISNCENGKIGEKDEMSKDGFVSLNGAGTFVSDDKPGMQSEVEEKMELQSKPKLESLFSGKSEKYQSIYSEDQCATAESNSNGCVDSCIEGTLDDNDKSCEKKVSSSVKIYCVPVCPSVADNDLHQNQTQDACKVLESFTTHAIPEHVSSDNSTTCEANCIEITDLKSDSNSPSEIVDKCNGQTEEKVPIKEVSEIVLTENSAENVSANGLSENVSTGMSTENFSSDDTSENNVSTEDFSSKIKLLITNDDIDASNDPLTPDSAYESSGYEFLSLLSPRKEQDEDDASSVGYSEVDIAPAEAKNIFPSLLIEKIMKEEHVTIRAMRKGYNILKDSRILFLTGHPGCGKTTCATNILKMMRNEIINGKETRIHFVHRFKQYEYCKDEDEFQITLFDDCFINIDFEDEMSIGDVETFLGQLMRIRMKDENVAFVFSLSTTAWDLLNKKFTRIISHLGYAVIDMSEGPLTLTAEEKEGILRHIICKTGCQTIQYYKDESMHPVTGNQIIVSEKTIAAILRTECKDPIGFPQLCTMMCMNMNRLRGIHDIGIFRFPTTMIYAHFDEMAKSINADDKMALCIIIYAALNNRCFDKYKVNIALLDQISSKIVRSSFDLRGGLRSLRNGMMIKLSRSKYILQHSVFAEVLLEYIDQNNILV